MEAAHGVKGQAIRTQEDIMTRYELTDVRMYAEQVTVDSTDGQFLTWALATAKTYPKVKVSYSHTFGFGIEKTDRSHFKWTVTSELVHRGWEPFNVASNQFGNLTHSFRKEAND
jgi:hypothetical protein